MNSVGAKRGYVMLRLGIITPGITRFSIFVRALMQEAVLWFQSLSAYVNSAVLLQSVYQIILLYAAVRQFLR